MSKYLALQHMINSTSKLLRYKEETCPDRSVGEHICPGMEVYGPIIMLVLISYRRMNGVSSERVTRFRVSSFVSLLPAFVWIFPLRLQILSDQESFQNVTDTVGIHL